MRPRARGHLLDETDGQPPPVDLTPRPNAATEASAVWAADWQPKIWRIESGGQLAALAEGDAERGADLSELGAHREAEEIGATLAQGRDLSAGEALGQGQRLLQITGGD